MSWEVKVLNTCMFSNHVPFSDDCNLKINTSLLRFSFSILVLLSILFLPFINMYVLIKHFDDS